MAFLGSNKWVWLPARRFDWLFDCLKMENVSDFWLPVWILWMRRTYDYLFEDWECVWLTVTCLKIENVFDLWLQFYMLEYFEKMLEWMITCFRLLCIDMSKGSLHVIRAMPAVILLTRWWAAPLILCSSGSSAKSWYTHKHLNYSYVPRNN